MRVLLEMRRAESQVGRGVTQLRATKGLPRVALPRAAFAQLIRQGVTDSTIRPVAFLIAAKPSQSRHGHVQQDWVGVTLS
jgi:hypothetical protein